MLKSGNFELNNKFGVNRQFGIVMTIPDFIYMEGSRPKSPIWVNFKKIILIAYSHHATLPICPIWEVTDTINR